MINQYYTGSFSSKTQSSSSCQLLEPDLELPSNESYDMNGTNTTVYYCVTTIISYLVVFWLNELVKKRAGLTECARALLAFLWVKVRPSLCCLLNWGQCGSPALLPATGNPRELVQHLERKNIYILVTCYILLPILSLSHHFSFDLTSSPDLISFSHNSGFL